MNKVLLGFILCSIFLAACVKNQAESQQSIQDIVSQAKEYGEVAKENKTEINQTSLNQTKINQTKAEPVKNETMQINRKCRYSAILYGGCKWTTKDQTAFTLKIQSSAKKSIPGVWYRITGDSGAIKLEKKEGDILGGGTRTYTIDYAALVKEIGIVKKFDILPIEVSNGTEYACENQRVYTIPSAYCKPSEPTRINNDGSINTTG